MSHYLKYFNAYTVHKKVPLSEAEYMVLKEAKETLDYLVKLTQGYSVLVESYRKVELTKFELELNHVLFDSLDYQDLYHAFVKLNGPISAYLSSTKYYLDSNYKILKHILKIMYAIS